MNFGASKFNNSWLILLICVINLEFAVCYKCEFKGDNYKCDIIPDSSSIEEQHIDGKTDDDVKVTIFNGTVNDVLHLTQSELSPFCQRFKNSKKIIVSDIKSVDENLYHQCTYIINAIWITDSEIEELPENLFFEHHQLTGIHLTGNKLNTLPENVFSNQEYLKNLYLSLNQIFCLPSDIFKSLKELWRLYLNGNKIQSLNPKWFESLQSLEYLWLNDNKIQDLPKNVFAHLRKMGFLYLNENQLTTIHSDSFGNIRNLWNINLDNNKINTIDKKFIDKTSAEILELRRNVCINEKINDKRNELLKNCYNNYQTREDQSKQHC